MAQKHKFKIQNLDGVKYKYGSDWTNNLEKENHWRLYWQQQKLLERNINKDDMILEIGVGSGFCANYLRSKDYNVTTMDIDPDKNPDIISNIVTYDFSKVNFDHLLAFEIFEHIPYDEFIKCLKKIRDSSIQNVFFSVPLNSFSASLTKRLNHIGTFKVKVSLDTNPRRNYKLSQTHFWEIGCGLNSLSKIEKDIQECGFDIIQSVNKLSKLFFHLKKIII